MLKKGGRKFVPFTQRLAEEFDLHAASPAWLIAADYVEDGRNRKRGDPCPAVLAAAMRKGLFVLASRLIDELGRSYGIIYESSFRSGRDGGYGDGGDGDGGGGGDGDGGGGGGGGGSGGGSSYGSGIGGGV